MKATPSGPLLNGYSLLSRWNISLSFSLSFPKLIKWTAYFREKGEKKKEREKVFETEPRQLPVEYYKYHLPRNRENVVFFEAIALPFQFPSFFTLPPLPLHAPLHSRFVPFAFLRVFLPAFQSGQDVRRFRYKRTARLRCFSSVVKESVINRITRW